MRQVAAHMPIVAQARSESERPRDRARDRSCGEQGRRLSHCLRASGCFSLPVPSARGICRWPPRRCPGRQGRDTPGPGGRRPTSIRRPDIDDRCRPVRLNRGNPVYRSFQVLLKPTRLSRRFGAIDRFPVTRGIHNLSHSSAVSLRQDTREPAERPQLG
jgi:hypothetical protein